MTLKLHMHGATNALRPGLCFEVQDEGANVSGSQASYGRGDDVSPPAGALVFTPQAFTPGRGYVPHDGVGCALLCTESGALFGPGEPIPVAREKPGARRRARTLQVLMTQEAAEFPGSDVAPQVLFSERAPGGADRRLLELPLQDWRVRVARRLLKAKETIHAVGFDFGTSHVGIAFCLDTDGRRNFVLTWDANASPAAGDDAGAGGSARLGSGPAGAGPVRKAPRRAIPLPVARLGGEAADDAPDADGAERPAGPRGVDYQALPTEILIYRHLIPDAPKVSIFGIDAAQRKTFKAQYFAEIKRLVDNPEYSAQNVWFRDTALDQRQRSKPEYLRNLPTPCVAIPRYYFRALIETLARQYELGSRLVVTASFTGAYTEPKRREFLSAIAHGFRMPLSRIHAVEESYSDALAWLAHPIFTRGTDDGGGVMRENNELLRELCAELVGSSARLATMFPVAANKAERRALARRAPERPPHPGAYVQAVTFNMGGGTTDLSSTLFPIDATHHARYFTRPGESADEVVVHADANRPIRPVNLGHHTEPFVGGTFHTWQLAELLKYRLVEMALDPADPRAADARRFLIFASHVLQEDVPLSDADFAAGASRDRLRRALGDLLAGRYAFHHRKSPHWEAAPGGAADSDHADEQALIGDTPALLAALEAARHDPAAAADLFGRRLFHPKTVARFHHSNDHRHLMFRLATDDVTLTRANGVIRRALQTNYGLTFDATEPASHVKRGLAEALRFIAEHVKTRFALDAGTRVQLAAPAALLTVDPALLSRAEREEFQSALRALHDGCTAFAARHPEAPAPLGPAALEGLFTALGLQAQAVLRYAVVPLAGALHNALALFRADGTLDLPRPTSFRTVFERLLADLRLLFGPDASRLQDATVLEATIADVPQACRAARALLDEMAAGAGGRDRARAAQDADTYEHLQAKRRYLEGEQARMRAALAGRAQIDPERQAELRHCGRLLREVETELARLDALRLEAPAEAPPHGSEFQRLQALLDTLAARVGRLWNHPQTGDGRLFHELWLNAVEAHEAETFAAHPRVRRAFDALWALAGKLRAVVLQNPGIALYSQAFDEDVPERRYRDREGRLFQKVLILAGQGSGFALVRPLLEGLVQYHVALGNERLRELRVVSDFTAGARPVAPEAPAGGPEVRLRRKLSGAVGCLYHANFLLSGKNYLRVAPMVRTLRLGEWVVDGGEWPDQLLVPDNARHGTTALTVRDEQGRAARRVFVVWKHLPNLDRPWGVGEHLSLFVLRGHPDCLGIFKLGTLSGKFTHSNLYLTCLVARQDHRIWADTRYTPVIYHTSDTHPDEPGELLSQISQEYGIAVTLPGWRFLTPRAADALFHNFLEEPFLMLRPGTMPLLRDLPDMQVLDRVFPLANRTLLDKVFRVPADLEREPTASSLTERLLAGFQPPAAQRATDEVGARDEESAADEAEASDADDAPPMVTAEPARAAAAAAPAPEPEGALPRVLVAPENLLEDTDPEGLEPLMDFNPSESWRRAHLGADQGPGARGQGPGEEAAAFRPEGEGEPPGEPRAATNGSRPPLRSGRGARTYGGAASPSQSAIRNPQSADDADDWELADEPPAADDDDWDEDTDEHLDPLADTDAGDWRAAAEPPDDQAATDDEHDPRAATDPERPASAAVDHGADTDEVDLRG